MSFTVMLSPDVRKYLDGLDAKRVKNIKNISRSWRLILSSKPRSACDIDVIEGSGIPLMYRLRMGNFRAVYFVDETDRRVYVTDLFPKKRDSAYGKN